MAKEKRKEILLSRYYDGRKKIWNSDNFIRPEIPTPELVRSWNQKCGKIEEYPEQERALDKLFNTLCPKNANLDDILIKVCTLNDFYSTNIFNVVAVAKEIQRLSIDKRLQNPKRDISIVMDLTNAVKKVTGKSIYSFATKYCSHHKPELYPIYDSYVDLLLKYYRDNEGLSTAISFENNDLKNYYTFCDVIDKFRIYYKLGKFSVKEIDKFLWQMGKEYFPKWEIIKIE